MTMTGNEVKFPIDNFTNNAHIIYVFYEKEKCLKNAVEFISEGIDKGHNILLIESKSFFENICERLIANGYNKNKIEQILFIESNIYYLANKKFQAKQCIQYLEDILQPSFNQNATVRIWGQVPSHSLIISQLISYECECDKVISKKNVTSVCSYNGLTTPSFIQNEMLKVHKYFMLDDAVTLSPFYSKENLQILSQIEKNRIKSIEVENKLLKEKNEKLHEIREHLYSEKEKAEKANHMKSVFLSQISHDLRTPLNTIQGYIQIMLMQQQTYQNMEKLNKIFDASAHLLGLIEDLLDFSAIEAEKIKINIEKINLKRFIENCIHSNLKFSNSNYNIFVQSIEDDLYIEADPLRLEQILNNLLTNAVKYNKPNGFIHVYITYEEASFVRIHVEDTGIGISTDELDLIFTPFYRSKSIMQKFEGTGLGLAIVAKLTEKMNGKYGVFKNNNNGSTFWVSFKKVDKPKKSIDQKKTYPTNIDKSISQKKILYIEDNINNIELMKDMLKVLGEIELVIETSGCSGIAKAIEVKPDLILLDLGLPDINGIEVLAKLQTNPITEEIPIVVVSADANQLSEEQAKARGSKAFITKPIELHKLLETINKLV